MRLLDELCLVWEGNKLKGIVNIPLISLYTLPRYVLVRGEIIFATYLSEVATIEIYESLFLRHLTSWEHLSASLLQRLCLACRYLNEVVNHVLYQETRVHVDVFSYHYPHNAYPMNCKEIIPLIDLANSNLITALTLNWTFDYALLEVTSSIIGYMYA